MDNTSEKKRFPRSRRNRRRKRNYNKDRPVNEYPPLGGKINRSNTWVKDRSRKMVPQKSILTKAQEGFVMISSFPRFSDSPPIPPFI